MKKIIRPMALLLSLALLMPAVVSCSENNAVEESVADTFEVVMPSGDESVETEPESEYISDDLPDKKFDGYAFRILSCVFYNKELATYLTMDEMTGVPVDDALYESRTNIEERFDVNISWIETGNEGAGKTVAQNSINAGDDSFDILIGHDTNTVSLGKSGLLRNLYDFEQFDFDKPWWPKNCVESWTVSGKLFTASNYMSYCGLHWTRAIVYNKTWAGDINLPNLYDLVREGTWTLDKLYELTEGVSYDYDGNGKMTEDDKVGFTSGGQTWYCMQEAVDLPIYRHNENGEIVLDLDVERADKYVEIMRKLTAQDRFVSSGDFGTQMFVKGNALFSYTQVGDAYDYVRISDIKYGFLPTPKLDENQENYINACTDVPWAIPKTVTGNREEIVATVCEAMSCYNYNHVLPAYFEVALKNRAADAPDDAEMLQIIADTRTIGFAYGYSMTMNNVFGDLRTSTKEVASYFKSAEKLATKTLGKLQENFEKMN